MSEREVRIKFTGDSAVLKGAAKDVRTVFNNLVADENDARGAGEKLADAQRQVADSMRSSMAEISAAADVLADSLGPEMVQAIEASGRSVEDEVQKFQKLGLTLDDVKRDSDLLAQGMKELDDAGRMATGNVGDGLKKMSSSADQSRSVMANLAGNAISELPLVAGAIGPVNMALGQMVEYAVDGNIKLSGLAKLAGPMAGVGVAVSLIGNHMEQVAKSKAFEKARVERFTEALQKGATAAEAWDAALTGDGAKLEFVDAASGDVTDLTDELFRQGVTWEDLKGQIEGGEEAFNAWIDAQRLAESQGDASSDTFQDLNRIWQGGNQIIEARAKAEEQAAREAFVFGEVQVEVAAKIDNVSEATKEGTRQAKLAKTAIKEEQTAYENLIGALSDDAAWQQLAINLGEMPGQFAALTTSYEDGQITAEEYWRQTALLTDESKIAVADFAREVLNLPESQITKIIADVGPTTNIDEFTRKLQLLYDLSVRMSQADWWWMQAGTTNTGNLTGNGSDGYGNAAIEGGPTPSRNRSESAGDTRGSTQPIVVQFVVNDRVVQEITAVQQQQQRGTR